MTWHRAGDRGGCDTVKINSPTSTSDPHVTLCFSAADETQKQKQERRGLQRFISPPLNANVALKYHLMHPRVPQPVFKHQYLDSIQGKRGTTVSGSFAPLLIMTQNFIFAQVGSSLLRPQDLSFSMLRVPELVKEA